MMWEGVVNCLSLVELKAGTGPDQMYIWAGCEGGLVVVWDIQVSYFVTPYLSLTNCVVQAQRVVELKGHKGGISALTTTEDHVWSCSKNCLSIRVWDKKVIPFSLRFLF